MPALRDERTKGVDSRNPALPTKGNALPEVSAPQAPRSREEIRSAIQKGALVSPQANSSTISDTSIAASLEALAQKQEEFNRKVLTPAQSLKTGAELNLASSEKQLAECGVTAWVAGLTAACEQDVAVSQKDLANKTAHAEKLQKVYESSLETKRAAEEMLLTAKRAEAQGFTHEAAEMRKEATDLLRQAGDALKGQKSLDTKQAAETIAGLRKLNQKLETAVNRLEWGATIAGGVKETAHTVGVGVGFALGGPAGGAAVNQGLRMVEGAAEESMRVALGEKSWKEAGASFLERSQDALVESAITGVSGAAGQKIGAVVQKLKGPTIAKVVDIVSSGTVQSAGTGVQIGYEYAKAHNEFQKEHGKLTGPELNGVYAKFMTERGFSLEEVSKKLGISFVAGAGAKGAFHGVEKMVSTGALERAKGVVADRVEDLTSNGVEIAGSGQPITVQTIMPALLGGHLTQRAVAHAGPHSGVVQGNAALSSRDGPHATAVVKIKDEATQVPSRTALAANATHEVNLNGVKGSIRVSGQGNAEYVSNRALLQERYAEQRTREIVSSDSSKTDMEARCIARQEALGVVAYYDKENKRVVIPEFKDMPKAEKQKIISFIHHEVLGHGRGGDELTAYRVQADKANQLGLELRLSDGRVSLRQPSANEPLHRTTDEEIRQHIAKNYTPGQLESRVVAAGMERVPELKINGEARITPCDLPPETVAVYRKESALEKSTTQVDTIPAGSNAMHGAQHPLTPTIENPANKGVVDLMHIRRADDLSAAAFKKEWQHKDLTYAQWEKQGRILTEDGIPSALTAKEYELVRTAEFKEWFGDWQNENHQISPVVIEPLTGEPKIWFRGDKSAQFDSYLIKPEVERTPQNYEGDWEIIADKRNQGVFFTNSRETALSYANDIHSCTLGNYGLHQEACHPKTFPVMRGWLQSIANVEPYFWRDSLRTRRMDAICSKERVEDLVRDYGLSTDMAADVEQSMISGRLRQHTPKEVVDSIVDQGRFEKLLDAFANQRSFDLLEYHMKHEFGQRRIFVRFGSSGTPQWQQQFYQAYLDYKYEPCVMSRCFIRSNNPAIMERIGNNKPEVFAARKEGHDVVLNKYAVGSGSHDEIIVFELDSIRVIAKDPLAKEERTHK